LFARLGLKDELRELPLPQPGSNRGYEGIWGYRDNKDIYG
jgi:hypothetical protein